MHKNQKGFSVIEGLLILVTLGMLGGVGWYVYNSSSKANEILNNADNTSSTTIKGNFKKTESEPKPVDETADWLNFNALNKKYSIKIPDGWNLVSLDGSAPYALTSDKIKYEKGVKATINDSTDKEVVVSVFFMNYSSDFASGEPLGEKSKEYKTKSNYQVTQYKYYSTEDGPGLPKGSTLYEYRIINGTEGFQIKYLSELNASDQLSYIEKAIETLKLY